MRIRISGDALDDLCDGAAFYDRIQPGLGSHFTNCLYADIESLRLYAGTHAMVDGWHFMNSQRFPFIIWYGFKKEDVIVYAVLDGRADPKINEWKLRYRRT